MRQFDDAFRSSLRDLMRWRRDVRRFRTDPIDEAALMRCLSVFSMAPSVGLSEPWRIIRLNSPDIRTKAFENFKTANADALAGYSGEDAERYAGLKLSGMSDAPEQFAIYCDDGTTKGKGLGATTMPEMRRYSVVTAIMLFWLAARAEGIGVGWVSILDDDQLSCDLGVDDDWKLVGYLCVGYPESNDDVPELETLGWEKRVANLDIETR